MAASEGVLQGGLARGLRRPARDDELCEAALRSGLPFRDRLLVHRSPYEEMADEIAMIFSLTFRSDALFGTSTISRNFSNFSFVVIRSNLLPKISCFVVLLFFLESPTHSVDSIAFNTTLHINFQLSCAEGASCGLLPSHFKLTRSSNLMGIFTLSFEKILWSAKYDRENRKVYCPGRATSATHRVKRVGGMGEPKSEVHACFTSKQPQGCGASTTAVRKSEFEERGIS